MHSSFNDSGCMERDCITSIISKTCRLMLFSSLQAEDRDSGDFGRIHYELIPESNRGGYFSIGPTSGLLRTEREMSSVPRELLPFNLTVVAQDNPNHDDGVSHSKTVPVVVSIVLPSLE